jgi:hypothetical protein
MSKPSIKYIRNEAGHFVCPHCEKVTEKQNTMYYHIKKTHMMDLPYVCDKCEDAPRFLQKSSYMHHLATLHPSEAATDSEPNPYVGVSFTCPACPHSTHTKANMLIHYARTHCKDWIPAFTKSNNSCKCCSKTFASSSAYLYHSISCLLDTAPADHASIVSRIK